MSKLRTVAVLPTLFTLGNLVCGFFAIVVSARVDKPATAEVQHTARIGTMSPIKAFKALDPNDDVHNCMLSGWLILLAMIFDALDGHVARLAKATSDFGAQLDSLADLVTFGVAPAFLLVKMCPKFAFQHNGGVWVIAAAFAACAAMRLARFNVETDENDDHMHFTGLPSPAAAATIASFALLFYKLQVEGNEFPYAIRLAEILQQILPFFAALVALLMVSRIPYPHVVNQVFNGQRSFAHVVGLIFALALIVPTAGYSMPIASVLFVLWGPCVYAWQEYVQRKPHKEPLF